MKKDNIEAEGRRKRFLFVSFLLSFVLEVDEWTKQKKIINMFIHSKLNGNYFLIQFNKIIISFYYTIIS